MGKKEPAAIEHIKLSPLNLRKQFKGNEVIVLTGKKEGGKTTSIFAILNAFCDKWFDGIVMCRSERAQLSTAKLRYGGIMPPIAVHTTHDVDKILSFIAYADEWNTAHGYKPRRFIIVDDFGSDKKKFASEQWKEIITTARHSGITVILVLHSLKYLSEMREILEYVFLFRTNNKRMIKFYWEEFAGVIESPKVWEKTFRHYMKFPRASVVIDCKASDDDARKCMFWFQPPVASEFNFTVCLNRELWEKNVQEGTLPNPQWKNPSIPKQVCAEPKVETMMRKRTQGENITRMAYNPPSKRRRVQVPQWGSGSTASANVRWTQPRAIEQHSKPFNTVDISDSDNESINKSIETKNELDETEYTFTEGGKKKANWIF